MINLRLILRLTSVVVAAVIFGLNGGCTATPVQPWERATLMSYPMRKDRDPLAGNLAEHTWFSREASAGGKGVGGSGCGCN